MLDCPCSFLENGEIDSCEECPYVPVYGQDDTWMLKEKSEEEEGC
jgi:hypothetical protein